MKGRFSYVWPIFMYCNGFFLCLKFGLLFLLVCFISLVIILISSYFLLFLLFLILFLWFVFVSLFFASLLEDLWRLFAGLCDTNLAPHDGPVFCGWSCLPEDAGHDASLNWGADITVPLYSVFFTSCATKQFVQFALCTALHPELFITFQPCILIKEFFLSELVCQKMGEKKRWKKRVLVFLLFFRVGGALQYKLGAGCGALRENWQFSRYVFHTRVCIWYNNILFALYIYIYLYTYIYIYVYNERRWKKVY